MPKKKLGIREILALNLKLNRQKCGLTQEKLAEKAGISSNYLSMVEISKKFPTPEMLDRLAEALEIDTIQLFDVSSTPEERALLHLEKSILDNINKQQQQAQAEMKKTVANAVKESLRETRNGESKPRKRK
jgi:transcriptional regulator with XRE-family HTH domain